MIKRHHKTKRYFKTLVLLFLVAAIFAGMSLWLARPSLAGWWPSQSGGSSWGQRKQLAVTNNSGAAISSGTAIAVAIDTQSLYQSGKIRSDCADLRIVYQADSSTYKELTRYLVTPGNLACSASGSTKVYFQLQTPLANNASSNLYYLYFANPQATAPTGTDAVFNVGSKTATLICPFDGTTACAAGKVPSTATGALRYSGSKSAILIDGINDEINTGVNLYGWDDMTIEAWVKPLVSTFDYSWHAFAGADAGKGCCTWPTGLGYSGNYGGSFGFQLTVDNGTDAGPNVISGTTPIVNGQWYHVAAVLTGGRTASIFVNGHLENRETLPYSRLDTDMNWIIGNVYGSPHRLEIDEFRVSNIARYTADFAPPYQQFHRDTNTKLLYHFDENGSPANGDVIIDDSGNGYNGTNNGGKYIAGLVGVDPVATNTGYNNSGAYASHEGIFIEEGTTNKIPNPSFENASYNSGWTAGSELAASKNTDLMFVYTGTASAGLVKSSLTNYDNSDNSSLQLYQNNNTKRLSQGFQIASSTTVGAIALKLNVDTYSAYYLRTDIETNNSGIPSNAIVTNGTSDCRPVNELSQYDNLAFFRFPTPPSLTSSTQYHLVLRGYTNSGCTTEASSVIPDTINWRFTGSGSSYASGDRATMNTSNVWTAGTGQDHSFYIYSAANSDITTAVNPGNTNVHTLSAYVYLDPALSANYRNINSGNYITSDNIQLVWEGVSEPATLFTKIGGGWWRLSYSAATTNTSNNYGIRILGGTFYIDSVQLEESSYATTYADGSLGSGYAWTGTANNSSSTRTAAYIDYPESNISKNGGTVSFWYKPQVDTENGAHGLFVWPGVGAQDGIYIYTINPTSPDLRLEFRTNGGVSRTCGDATSLTLNQWYFVTLTYTANSGGTDGCQFYYNGSGSGGSTNQNWSFNPGSNNLVIGNANSTAAGGSMSDFRIYNSALTSTQVADLYNSGLVAHTEGFAVDRFTETKGQNPVGIWHFDEGSGTVAHDSGIYGNDLTLTSASWATSSASINKRSQYLTFNGTDSKAVRTPDSDFDFGTGSFSVSGWFRHPDTISGTQTILSRYSSAAGFKVYMDSGGHVCFGIDDDPSWGPDDKICSTQTYTDNVWHHFEAVNSSASDISLYIDAIRTGYKSSLNATGTLSSSSALYIGADTSNTNWWTGNIDEIYIYPYARTADQVKIDYFGRAAMSQGSQTSDPFMNGLKGYWKMDEFSGPSLDSSGNGNSGTWQGNTGPSGGKYSGGTTFDGSGDYIDAGNIGL